MFTTSVRLRRQLVVGILALVSSSVAALQLPQLPQLDADHLVREGRIDEARAAFAAWLDENAGSQELFAVLLRRLALDPDPQSVEQAAALYAAWLSDEQVAVLRMMPIDFAELSGSHERALQLMTTAGAASPLPGRAALLAGELGTDGAAARSPAGAAALYQRALELARAGDGSAARDALAALTTAYPGSPERHLAERQLRELRPSDAEPAITLDDGDARPTVVPFPAPVVLLGSGSLATDFGVGELVAAVATASATATDGDADTGADFAAEAPLPVPRYTIQTGAYADAVNAEHVTNQLRQAGFPAQVAGSPTAEGTPVHRVLVGARLERAGAERVLSELRAAGYDGFLRLDN